MVAVRRGLTVCVTGLMALLALLRPGVAGWAVGLACGGVLAVAAARRARIDEVEAFGPADLVTLTRATLACAVAGLVAASYAGGDVTTTLVPLTALALAMDFVDGRVARRTQTASAYGGRLDGEADAFLILVLSAYLAQDFGAWVLSMGLIRYAYALATRVLGWMQQQLPPRYWRKVVAAFVGISMTLAASGLAPAAVTWAVLGLAALLLAESFGWDVVWLWRRRSMRRMNGSAGVASDTTITSGVES